MTGAPEFLPPRDPDPHPIARWLGAFLGIFYGISKLVGAQFLVLDSMLSRPMASVPGFWLTWYYFGASTPYKWMIAGAEILAGILLVFPRTALLGALLLLPIAGNVVAIDLFFGVDLGGTLAAVVLLGTSLVIVLPERRRLLAVVLVPRADGKDWRRGVVIAVLVVTSLFFHRWIRREIVEHPTPIDGTWAVIRTVGAGRWDRVFFERERAALAVFRDSAGRDRFERFAIDSAGRIDVWQDYYASEPGEPLGPRIWEGELGPDSRITLRGLDTLHAGTLTLLRVGEPGRPTPRRWWAWQDLAP